MVRPPCCDKLSVKRGLWTAEEDAKILAYVSKHGTGNWTAVPKKAGLRRCGKSCRLRWTNYLRPDLKHESFTPQEEEMIVRLHAAIGSRWSIIAQQLPGRTDNDVKNYWNTKLRKKLTEMGIDPVTHKPFSQILADYGNINGAFPKSRIGSLNRDLKNYAFLVKSSDNHFFNSQNISNNPMDLLAQLQAINFVTQPSNNYFESNNDNTQQPQPQPQPQPHILSEEAGCSFSSNSSSTSSTCNSSADHNLFSWRDFLLEDAFVDDAQQQQQQERDINLNLLSVRDEDEEVQQLDNGSFVETMLDQDNKMMLEFPQLLHEPFYY